MNRKSIRLILLILVGLILACARSAPLDDSTWVVPQVGGAAPAATSWLVLPPTRVPGAPILTPTPDQPHKIPELRLEPVLYIVQPGDTLGLISNVYSVSVEQIMKANRLNNPDILEVGQQLEIPVATPEGAGLDFKIIPDSELVYGPLSVYFDAPGFVKAQAGYLADYQEKIYDEKLTGIEIIQLVAQNYSVNPRLLLAVLEHQSGWITQQKPKQAAQQYPIGLVDQERKGLYRQIAWAANNLNRGYYLWRVNGASSWVLADGRVVPVNPIINAGTAGVQHFFSKLMGFQEWKDAVGEGGLFATYNRLFGYPFDFALEPLLPAELTQPKMQLPFESGVSWVFTGGPHGGWDSGSAWAALDFAPDSEALGCVQSELWVTAVADGPVVRVGDGVVLQEINDPNGMPSDGWEQTGWAVLYMHIESRDRVPLGTHLKAGDLIGHPSCEGGISSGTHVHVARKFHGEWIPADQTIPFVLDSWVSIGVGVEYDGYLKRGGEQIEAYAGATAKNRISR